ncbi:MAG: hypothetical protein CMO16_06645, partial [Thaumarchaeota archaeon]|nr:hypothetical protein [Nitrososphaerota archaeon]
MSNEFPEWAEKEINSITNSSFIPQDDLEGTGYFLDIDKKNRKADFQFYEKLPTGKHIVTANIPKNIKIDELMKGFVYICKLKILKASLSTKLSNYLKENEVSTNFKKEKLIESSVPKTQPIRQKTDVLNQNKKTTESTQPEVNKEAQKEEKE